MFSTTTMESSTSRPSATTKPAMESWLSEYPRKYRQARPNDNDRGIETMTMPAARNPSGSSVSMTSAIAMPKSMYSRLSRELTFFDWSNPTSSLMRLGNSSAKALVTAITRSRTSRML